MAPVLPSAGCRLHVHARAGRARAAARAAAPRIVPCAGTTRRRAASLRVRAEAAGAASAPAVQGTNSELMKKLSDAIAEVQTLPPSMRKEGSEEAAVTVRAALSALKAQGGVTLFDSWSGRTMRRNTMLGELRQVGVKQPEVIGVPSVRDDAAFLITVVLSTSVLALVLGQLPGDWGFFGMYLSGGISIAVLAVGSVAPGLLQIPISLFSNVFPDYRDRVLRHEAAHFLIAYLLGVPVVGYSLDLGKEHTDLLESRLQRKIVGAQRLSDDEIDALAVIAMSGVAAEAMTFPEVTGQTADLIDLQRLMNRSASPLAPSTQQSMTRWAVWQAAVLLRANPAAYDALREAMARRASVAECIQAIERAAAADKAAAAAK